MLHPLEIFKVTDFGKKELHEQIFVPFQPHNKIQRANTDILNLKEIESNEIRVTLSENGNCEFFHVFDSDSLEVINTAKENRLRF